MPSYFNDYRVFHPIGHIFGRNKRIGKKGEERRKGGWGPAAEERVIIQ